jgi:hypothetical protein
VLTNATFRVYNVLALEKSRRLIRRYSGEAGGTSCRFLQMTKMTNEIIKQRIQAKINSLHELRRNDTRKLGNPARRSDSASYIAQVRGLEYALALLNGNEPKED